MMQIIVFIFWYDYLLGVQTKDTFLFNSIVFGPIKSRRLGLSLGINVLPLNYKLCNLNCIYCECGWNKKRDKKDNITFYSRKDISSCLEQKLVDLKHQKKTLDAITFAGNGEPTLHPKFEEIIEDTIKLRNKIFPHTKIAVLSNATLLQRTKVVQALQKIDLPILKLDAGTEDLYKIINQPQSKKSLLTTVQQLSSFKGNLIIQSIFLKGFYKGTYFDNSSDKDVECWLKLLQKINPKKVMIYSINRATAAQDLQSISKDRLHEIELRVHQLGINTLVV